MTIISELKDWAETSVYEEMSLTSSGLHECTMNEIFESYRDYVESRSWE